MVYGLSFWVVFPHLPGGSLDVSSFQQRCYSSSSASPPLSLLLLLLLPLLPLPVFVLSSSFFAFSSLAALACYFASSGCSGDPNTISRAQEAVEWAWPDPNTCQRECQKECQNRCQIECWIECQNRCRHIECQIQCQSFCQKECQNICAIYSSS